MQNAKCNSAKCKIWFCVGVRHILREAWLFALAYPAHLLATVVFVTSALLCELSNEKISIFVSEVDGYRHLILLILQEAHNVAILW